MTTVLPLRRASTMAALFLCLSAPATAAGPKTYVSCYHSKSGHLKFHVRPSTCIFNVLGTAGSASGANAVYVDTLKWKHWGQKKATATGVEHGNMDTSFKADVTLSQRSACNGRTAYGKVTIRSEGKVVFSFKLYSCDVGE